MIPAGEIAPMTLRPIMPWLALGHGVFNFTMMLLFFYQGWMGHAIRKARRAGGAAPYAAVRRHRKAGPILAMLGAAGFLSGMLMVFVSKGKFIDYPLHLLTGLVIVLCLGVTSYISRGIDIHNSASRTPHAVIGILILGLYPVQLVLGLGKLL
jgi:hypothetical protein